MDPSGILGVRWVHVFEEDTASEQIYKPASGPIPLSRRPREAVTLYGDGTATVEAGGPDDRPTGRRATWRAAGEELIVEVPGDGGGSASTQLHILRASPDRLVAAPPRG